MKKKGTRRCLHQDTKSLITPSLHLCFFHTFMQAIGCQDVVLCCLLCLYNAFIYNKQTNNMLKQNKDVGVGL